MTFKEAREKLINHLRETGWEVKTDLKVPWARTGHSNDRITLWFKPQAVWYSLGHAHSLNMARSLWIDIRALNPSEFVSKLEDFKKRNLL